MNIQKFSIVRVAMVSILTMTLVLTGLANSASADGIPLNIRVSRLICLEETDEVGADEPYIVTLSANLRNAESMIASDLFLDVDQGESRQPGLNIGNWTGVEHPDDLIVMVMMVESDRSGGVVKNGTTPFVMGANVNLQNKIPSLVTSLKTPYAEGRVNRANLKSHLFQMMVAAMQPAQNDDGDDFINIHELRLSPTDLSKDGQRVFQRQIEFVGDGGRYLMTFEITSGEQLRSAWSNPSTDNSIRGLIVDGILTASPKITSGNGNSNSSSPTPGSGQNTSPGNQNGGLTSASPNNWPGFGSPNESSNTSQSGGLGATQNNWIGGNCNSGNGQTTPGNQSGNNGSGLRNSDIQGTWSSNLGLTYQIQQSGSTFTWQVDALQEKSQGSINGNQLQARWTNAMGSDSGAGRISSTDSAGRANRIEWTSGVVFTR